MDSIQGRRIDSMIRNRKRSLSRDLVRVLQYIYIDDCAITRFAFVNKSAVNVSFMGSSRKVRGSDGKNPQDFGVARDREELAEPNGEQFFGTSRGVGMKLTMLS